MPRSIPARELLARLITGGDVDLSDVTGTRILPLLERARAEGVLALAAWNLPDRADVAPALRAQLSESALGLAAASLMRESACRKVLAVLPDDLPVLVLKGTALAQWLYPESYLRESSDIDLYFASRQDAQRAAALLAPLGYATPFQPGRFAHEFLCRRHSPHGPVDLDMHWALTASPLFQRLPLFAQWHADSQPLPGLGDRARGLGPVHAFLHASLHRASNLSVGLGDRLKWLYDLHLLARRFDGVDWSELQRLCIEYGLCGVCAQAILATRAELGTSFPAETLGALQAGADNEALDASRLGDWRYIQRQNFLALPGRRARVQWLLDYAFPSADYLRELYGVDVSRPRLWWLRAKRAFGRLARR
ncbi:MAG: nucleotidyltransferase family protein [Luteimonas sp.]